MGSILTMVLERYRAIWSDPGLMPLHALELAQVVVLAMHLPGWLSLILQIQAQ
jgi:hypothetical protein